MVGAREDIYRYLFEKLSDGAMAEGAKLPTEMELARRFRTNRMAAHLAVKRLEKEGVVIRKKRVGTFVAREASARVDGKANVVRERVVYAVASLHERREMHWRHSTLTEMESALSANGAALRHLSLPEKPKKRDLDALLEKLDPSVGKALAIWADADETALFLENQDALYSTGLALYLLDQGSVDLGAWRFHMLRFNPFGEGTMAVAHVWKTARRKFAFCDGLPPLGRYWLEERKRGARVELARLSGGAATLEDWRFDRNVGADAIAEKIQAFPGEYALIAANDYCAALIVDAAERRGLARDRDYFPISFDNDPATRHYNLTTIAPPIEGLGKRFADLIAERLDAEGPTDIVSIKLASRVIARRRG